MISQEFVALELIIVKSEFFGENFATMSELNQFTEYMQQKFNEQELGVVIEYKLSMLNFNIRDEIITITDECCLSINMLPDDIINILTNKSLILSFLIDTEKNKIKMLEELQQKSIESDKNNNLAKIYPK